MSRSRNIFLIGLPAAGKSTIGKQLADELKMTFIDTDEVIEERCGADIAWIFDIEGEAGFRKREQKVVHELTEKNGIILATGGGVVCTPENCTRLAARGTVVYLKTTIDQQVDRTLRDKKRPLLQVEDKRAQLEKLQEERGPIYEEIADLIIETDRLSIRAIVNAISKAFLED